jgi:hypothetical protein
MQKLKSTKQKDMQRDDAAPNETQRDLWFNPHLGPCGKPAHNVIGVPVLAVKAHKRKRALKGKNLNTLYGTLIALLANLIYHHLIDSPGQGIPVPRSKKALGRKGNRYQPSFPRSFPRMLDALCDLGFAKQTLGKFSGFPGQSKQTAVRAGPKLIELIQEQKVTLEDLGGTDKGEIIILSRPKRGHWDEGERIDYTDNATTNRFRSELRAINTWLERADVRFDATAHSKPVNVQARQLRRQFTLGRFDRGGRLFGGFWENLPKPVRLQGIRIDGEPVVGLDYSQLNPLLAYRVAEADPPAGDAYTLRGLEKCRDGVKKVFNAMLFKHPVRKLPKGSRRLFPLKVECKDVTEAILLRHPMLKGVLSYPETGHQLQFLESEIMMRVLRQCQKRNTVALPVFDCVVVKASVEDTVREIMRREFKAVAGFDVVVKRELPLQSLAALGARMS